MSDFFYQHVYVAEYRATTKLKDLFAYVDAYRNVSWKHLHRTLVECADRAWDLSLLQARRLARIRSGHRHGYHQKIDGHSPSKYVDEALNLLDREDEPNLTKFDWVAVSSWSFREFIPACYVFQFDGKMNWTYILEDLSLAVPEDVDLATEHQVVEIAKECIEKFRFAEAREILRPLLGEGDGLTGE